MIFIHHWRISPIIISSISWNLRIPQKLGKLWKSNLHCSHQNWKIERKKWYFPGFFFKLLFFPVMIIYIVLCIPINLSSFCLSGLKFFRQILVLFWIYFNLTIFLVKSIQSGLEYLINPDRKTWIYGHIHDKKSVF